MEILHGSAMLATLGGFLALLLGLLLLLLPLLISELSRPRDSAWGAVVLLLGLVLVTSSDRLTGAPMLAVLCGGLLIGRLGSEVAQARWRALSDEERLALGSSERWRRSLHQLGASLASLLQSALVLVAAGQAWLRERRSGQGRSHGKRWVRREQDSEPSPQAVPETTEVPEATAVAGTAGDSSDGRAAGSLADSLAEDHLPAAVAASSASEADGAAGPAARPVEAAPAAEGPIPIRTFDDVDALLDQVAGAAEPLQQDP